MHGDVRMMIANVEKPTVLLDWVKERIKDDSKWPTKDDPKWPMSQFCISFYVFSELLSLRSTCCRRLLSNLLSADAERERESLYFNSQPQIPTREDAHGASLKWAA
eukprot:c21350_g2_i1 orf=156-473(+)